MVSEKSRTMKEMKIWPMLMSKGDRSECSAVDVDRLRPTREKRKNGISRFCTDNRGQLFTRRAPHPCDAAEGRQERFAPARPDAGNVIELRSQIAHRPCAAVERDGEAVRFVADSLDQEQRRIVGRQGN